MSRYTKTATDKVLIYGWDHALGYFYEEWLPSELDSEEGKPFNDRCTMFGMKKDEFLDKLHQYRVRNSHIEAAAGDIPI